jgi:thioredoxin reductase (NADPH)
VGGNTTVQEANYLTRFAKKVSIVHRGRQFSAQRIAQERALGNPKIDVLWNTVVTAILGEQGVRAVRLRSIDDGAERELAVEGVFIFIGFTPNRIKAHAKHDALGFFLTDERMETSIAGIVAVGDIRAQPVRQLTNTVADGTVAAIMAQSISRSMIRPAIRGFSPTRRDVAERPDDCSPANRLAASTHSTSTCTPIARNCEPL